jgi:sugar lactone lactonase YvrE
MSELHTLLTGVVFGESPRWHDGRLWFADWGRGEIIAVDRDGRAEVVVRVPGEGGFAPSCIDWLPDGRLLLVSGSGRALLRQEPDGSLVTHADLSEVYGDDHWNDIAADGRGNVYVNNIGFAFPGGEFVPGIVAVVTPDGSARLVADGLAFPNGMAVTADGSTLIVAESYGGRLTAFDIAADGALSNRRIWADLNGAAPDGICLDAEGAVWFGDVPNRNCVRVREGGEVVQTVGLDRGCFACALGGAQGRTLFLVAADWSNPAAMFGGEPTGQVLTLDVAVPA